MSISQGMINYNEGRRLMQVADQYKLQEQYQVAFELYLKTCLKFDTALRDIEFDPRKRGYRVLAERFLAASRANADEVKPKIPPPPIPQGYSTRPALGKAQNGKASGGAAKGASGPVSAENAKFHALIQEAIMIERPNVHWTDVAGLEEAKRTLNETVIMPLRFPQLFTDNRTPTSAILFYGPPGTGKSYLAKATATEATQYTFISISTSDLVSKWLGESEKLIRALFETARQNRPSIIFIDEIDSLLSTRQEGDSEAARRMQSEFLTQIDGVGNSLEGILLLAATNLPWQLDPAVRRRFEKRIYIPLPHAKAREELLRNKMRSTLNTLKNRDFSEIARICDGFSGSDLKTLVREASMFSLRRMQEAQYFVEKNGKFFPCKKTTKGAQKATMMDLDPETVGVPPVTPSDFAEVLVRVKPTVAKDDLKRYEQWTAQFGLEGI